jgi:predicted metalloprotease
VLVHPSHEPADSGVERSASDGSGLVDRETREHGGIHCCTLESATNAAYHIGDDYLQQHSRGKVQKETFTHGTSKQRQRWFMEGFNSADVKRAKLLFDLDYKDL